MKIIKSLLLSIVLTLGLIGITACDTVQSSPAKASESTTSPTVGQVTSETSQEQKSNDTEITLSIYNLNKESIFSEKIKTEKTNLLEIMSDIEALNMKTENSEGGKFIISIMDISYDYGKYWHCYVNEESLQENISLYEVKNNDVIDMRYEKVGE